MCDERAALEQEVRARGFEPSQLIWPWEPGPRLRRWLAAQAVDRRPAERLQVAFHQLLAASGRGLEYDAAVTGTADEVFAHGRANCLGFSMLFVGIARQLGLEAGFLRVEGAEGYRREGDLIFVSEHLTAGYRAEGREHRVEFQLGPAAAQQRVRRISDLTALALFYSNRGSEALRAGDAAEAVRWLEVAARLDERQGLVWTNLGVARRRLGNLDAAAASYRHAIAVDPDHLPAYLNLAGVLRLRGAGDAAGEILELLDRADNRNPYAFLALGDASLEQGRLDEARRFYRRAVRLGRRQAEPRAAMGLWALASGNAATARRWLRRAQRIDESEPRTVRLAENLHAPSATPAATVGGAETAESEVES